MGEMDNQSPGVREQVLNKMNMMLREDTRFQRTLERLGRMGILVDPNTYRILNKGEQ